MPQHANHTLDVARETLAISEKSGDRTLKYVGLALLGMTGIATFLHAAHSIYRDLFAAKAKGERGRGERPPTQQAPHLAVPTEELPPGRHDPESGWVRRARLAGRPGDEPARPAYRAGPGHGR